MHQNYKKYLFILIKLLISASLLYLIFKKSGPTRILDALLGIKPAYFVLAVVIFIISQLLSTLRWQILLKENYGLKRLFGLYIMGAFFNRMLPGLVGGDAIKAFYLYRETNRGTEAMASVFMDRYLGFCALMALGMCAYPFGFRYFSGSWLQWMLPALAATFAVTSVLLFWLRLGKGIKFVNKIYKYIHSYIGRRRQIALALVISVMVQAMFVLAPYFIGLGLGIDVPFTAYMVFIPLIISASMIPISISGHGVREASFVMLFSAVGVSPDMATAISFAWFISIAIGSLPGLYEYLRYKKTSTQKELSGQST